MCRLRLILTGANTIQDVLDGINNTGKFVASWDSVQGQFHVSDPNAVAGNYGIRIEEKTKSCRDLGLLPQSKLFAKRAYWRSNCGKIFTYFDRFYRFRPAVTKETELESLNSHRTFNKGVNLGYIRITDKAGHFKAIDMRGAKTIEDVLDKINDPQMAFMLRLVYNEDQNGIEIIDKNNGAPGKLEIIDVDSTTAYDLGIVGKTVDNKWVGKDIDPGIKRLYSGKCLACK